MNKIIQLPKKFAILLINIYQFTLSPDHSWLKERFPYGFCRHYPTCSQYTKEAIDKFGVIKGAFLGFIRILKCNPWTESKVDTVPAR